MVLIAYPGTSVTDCHSMLSNIPEEQRPQCKCDLSRLQFLLLPVFIISTNMAALMWWRHESRCVLFYCPLCVLSRNISLSLVCSNSMSVTRLSAERKFIYLSKRESVYYTELRMILRCQVLQYFLKRVIWTCTLGAVQAIGETVTYIYFPSQQGVWMSCVLIWSCCCVF